MESIDFPVPDTTQGTRAYVRTSLKWKLPLFRNRTKGAQDALNVGSYVSVRDYSISAGRRHTAYTFHSASSFIGAVISASCTQFFSAWRPTVVTMQNLGIPNGTSTTTLSVISWNSSRPNIPQRGFMPAFELTISIFSLMMNGSTIFVLIYDKLLYAQTFSVYLVALLWSHLIYAAVGHPLETQFFLYPFRPICKSLVITLFVVLQDVQQQFWLWGCTSKYGGDALFCISGLSSRLDFIIRATAKHIINQERMMLHLKQW